MIKVQIIEDETLFNHTDSDAEVWLLSYSNQNEEGEWNDRCVVVEDVTDNFMPLVNKLPLIMTEVYKRHPFVSGVVKQSQPKMNEDGSMALDENGKQVLEEIEVPVSEQGFTYEVITRNKENFAIHAYVCDESSIRVVSDNAEMTMQGGSDDDTGNAENFNGDDERDDEDGTREM